MLSFSRSLSVVTVLLSAGLLLVAASGEGLDATGEAPESGVAGIVADAPADGEPSVACDDGFMVAYTETIPGTDVAFRMVPVEGGVVRLSVAPEGGEPAFCEVELPPYWIGETEVTWAQYRPYMKLDRQYAKLQQLTTLQRHGGAEAKAALSAAPRLANAVTRAESAAADPSTIAVDAVTSPTPLYDPGTTYESGEDPDLPAVTMTPFAAQQFTKWLAALTGHEYRLPSEAEWLHAGADSEPTPDALDEAAWYTDNSDWVAQTVGQKAPGRRGLVDLYGNVAELVLDAHNAKGRPELSGQRVNWEQAVAWPRRGDRRIAKGGWWDAEAEELTAAHRMPTDDGEWKASDPNLPKSPWWFADYPATGVGLRLVRPLRPMDEATRARVWDTQDAAVAKAVAERLREGRGKIGPIGADLPEALEELNSKPMQALLR